MRNEEKKEEKKSVKKSVKTQVLKFICFAALSFSAMSQAAQNSLSTNFFPRNNEEQKALVSLVNKKQYATALQSWNEAYGGTNFAQTYNGKASLYWLMFQSGLQVSALENLLRLQKPEHISPELIKAWTAAAPESHIAWRIAHIRWSNAWRRIFPARFQDLTELHNVTYVKNKKELNALVKEASSIQNNRQLRSWKMWQAALWAPIYDQVDTAIKLLEELERSNTNVVGKDRIALTKGRAYYQAGMLDQALLAYSQVPRSSDYWIEALEERAWANVRQDRQDRAIGDLMTISAPLFQPQVGPEPYFLIGLSNLMICDYPKVFKNSKEFQARVRPKLSALQGLSKSSDMSFATKAMTLLENGPYELATISSVIGSLPRLFHRDEFFTRHMLYRKAMVQEQNLKAQLGLGDEIINSKSLAERAEGSRKGVLERLKYLAKKELKEYSQNIQKMHLVEAEVIQRLYLDDSLKGRRTQKIADKVESSSETMVFPFNDEIWLDEIDNYRVSVKDCPKLELAQNGKIK